MKFQNGPLIDPTQRMQTLMRDGIYWYHMNAKANNPSISSPESSMKIMGQAMSNFEARLNQSLVGTLPIGTFTNLVRYLISFSVTAETCPLPNLLETQTQTLLELTLKQLFKKDGDLGVMLEDPVSLQCMTNASFTLVQDFFNELYTSLERQLHDLGLFVQATQLASHTLDQIRHHPFSESCTIAITRMQYCALCGSYKRFRPCRHMCVNTLRGCFADLAELHLHFQHFTTLLRSLSKSLIAELKPDVFTNTHLSHFVSMVDYLRDNNGVVREQVSYGKHHSCTNQGINIFSKNIISLRDTCCVRFNI